MQATNVGEGKDKGNYEISATWEEVKTLFISTVDAGYVDNNFDLQINRDKVSALITGWGKKSKFNGGYTCVDTLRWIRKGYHLPGNEIEDTNIVPLREKRVLINSDTEGDYHHERFISGEDNFYSYMTKRDRVPAVSVDAALQFTCNVDNKTIELYGRWLLQHLVELEYSGVDSGVSISSRTRGMHSGEKDTTPSRYTISVKEPNEVNDYLQWSALLSPTGFRHIMFLFYLKGADMLGKDCVSYLGYPVESKWACNYVPQWERIETDSNAHGAAFPQMQMTEDFFRAIEYAKTGIDPKE